MLRKTIALITFKLAVPLFAQVETIQTGALQLCIRVMHFHRRFVSLTVATEAWNRTASVVIAVAT